MVFGSKELATIGSDMFANGTDDPIWLCTYNVAPQGHKLLQKPH